MKVNRTLTRIVRNLRAARFAAVVILALASGIYGLGQRIMAENIFDAETYGAYADRSDMAIAVCIFASIAIYGELNSHRQR